MSQSQSSRTSRRNKLDKHLIRINERLKDRDESACQEIDNFLQTIEGKNVPLSITQKFRKKLIRVMSRRIGDLLFFDKHTLIYFILSKGGNLKYLDQKDGFHILGWIEQFQDVNKFNQQNQDLLIYFLDNYPEFPLITTSRYTNSNVLTDLLKTDFETGLIAQIILSKSERIQTCIHCVQTEPEKFLRHLRTQISFEQFSGANETHLKLFQILFESLLPNNQSVEQYVESFNGVYPFLHRGLLEYVKLLK